MAGEPLGDGGGDGEGGEDAGDEEVVEVVLENVKGPRRRQPREEHVQPWKRGCLLVGVSKSAMFGYLTGVFMVPMGNISDFPSQSKDKRKMTSGTASEEKGCGLEPARPRLDGLDSEQRLVVVEDVLGGQQQLRHVGNEACHHTTPITHKPGMEERGPGEGFKGGCRAFAYFLINSVSRVISESSAPILSFSLSSSSTPFPHFPLLP